eukprot:scaffold70203_cov31-Tisochrysis_lutea.AAC.6
MAVKREEVTEGVMRVEEREGVVRERVASEGEQLWGSERATLVRPYLRVTTLCNFPPIHVLYSSAGGRDLDGLDGPGEKRSFGATLLAHEA